MRCETAVKCNYCATLHVPRFEASRLFRNGGGGVGQGPGIAQYQHLNNCIPDIPIAYPYVS